MLEQSVFGIRDIAILSHSDKKIYSVRMEGISEDTEEALDKQLNSKGHFIFKTADNVAILNNDVILYGSIDLSNNSDLAYLEKFKNFILNPYSPGNWYYTSFDYEKGTINKNSVNKPYLGIDFISRNRYLDWFKYHYCTIGKPERIIIYKLENNDRLRNARLNGM